MPAPEIVVVPEAARGERLDRWLATLPDAPTRSQLTHAIAAGRVSVDEKPAKAGTRLRGGERVRIDAAPVRTSNSVAAEPIELEILYADRRVVAVNKPAGMVVHPATGNRAGTLVNALLHRFPDAELPGKPERAGIVHRLDRDTSGVILAALDVRAHESLARQFRERTIDKRYLTLVRGDVRAGGVIDLAIGRHPQDRKRMSVAARRSRAASTRYRPLERFGVATLLEVQPATGRTHQIRVHLAARGWPVVADPVYGVASTRTSAALRRKWGRAAAALEMMPRQALHAWRIRFEHPEHGRVVEVEAPLWNDLQSVLVALRDAVPGPGFAVDSRYEID